MVAGIMIPLAFFATFAYIVKTVSDNRLKRMIIEKDQVSENMKYLFTDKFALAVPTSLKWGMVLVSVGLAIILGQILHASNVTAGHDSDVLTFSIVFIFGGVALIAYYFIGNHMMKKQSIEK